MAVFLAIFCTELIEGRVENQTFDKPGGKIKPKGVDLIDCSSGGNVAHAKIPVGPGYQTAFAQKIRDEAGVMTGAVGMITSPVQAEHIIRTGQADAVIMAREFLRDPYWPLRAA